MKKLPLLQFLRPPILPRYLVVLLFGMIISTILPAQHRKIWMKHYDGGFVTMLQDRQGYIWGGGYKTGLWRYDGRHFKSFQNQSDDPDSLKGSTIVFLKEDSVGKLWIGSDYGLHFFDPEMERFENYQLDSAFMDPKNPYSSYIAYFHRDRQGGIWTGSIHGIHRWDPETMQSRQFMPEESGGKPVSVNFVGNSRVTFAFAEDHEGMLWFGLEGEGGLFRYDPYKERGRLFRHQPGHSNSLIDDRVHSLHVDPDGILWIGTANGLCRYVPGKEHFIRYPDTELLEPDGREQPVLEIDTDVSGRLWIIRPFAIQRFDKEKGQLKTHFQFPDWRPATKSINPISKDLSFYLIGEGRDGITWFSHTGDIARVFGYDPYSDTIIPHWLDGAGRREIDFFIALMVDRNGLLWLDYYFKGHSLLHQDIARERFAAFPDDGQRVNLESNINRAHYSKTATTSFYEDSEGKVWLNTETLSQYFPGTRRWTPSKSLLRNPHSGFKDNYLYPPFMLEDSKGNLWMAASESIIRISPEEKGKSFANLALGKPVRASSVAPGTVRLGPEFIVDERLETQWAGAHATEEEWIEIDLEKIQEIRRIELYWDKLMADNNFTYRLQISADGQNWRTFFTETIPTNESFRIVEAPIQGRFLRITGHERNPEREMELLDVRVYGPVPTFDEYQWPSQPDLVCRPHIVRDIHEDRQGRIWIAAEEGLGYYNETKDIFEIY